MKPRYNPSPMTARRPVRAASASGARGRVQQSLAPEHLSDATAAATVAVMVGGVALVISGIGIIAMGLTIGARYGGSPPPNAGSMVLPSVLLGLALLIFGAALTVGGVSVFNNVRRSRLATGVLAAVATALAALGTVLAMTTAPADTVLGIALTVAALVFGVSAILLLRPRR